MKPIILAVLLVAALPFVAASSAADDATSCVELGGASIWGGGGWNHVVYLSNRCSKPVMCTLTTSVDPDEKKAAVAVNTTTQVMTATNSQERVFVPIMKCETTP